MGLRKLNKEKKGSHVGMVLSFVIFIVFLLYIFSLINPEFGTRDNKKTLLETLEKNLLEETNLEVDVITLGIDSETDYKDYDCFKLPEIDGTENKKVIVKDKDNEIIPAKKESSGEISVKWKEINRNYNKLYFSEEFNSQEPSCDNPSLLGKGDYSINLRKKQNYTSKESSKNFSELTNTEIEEKIEIPAGVTFRFAFEYANGEEKGNINESKIPEDKNIYTNEFPVQYINKSAKTESGKLKTIVW